MATAPSDLELTCKFFRTFARFEYALKAAGLLRRGRDDNAEVNWKSVEARLRTISDAEKVALRSAAQVLLRNPPRKQVAEIRGGSHVLDWRVTGPAGDEMTYLTLMLRRVRNNLFHGGKETDTGDLSERGRGFVISAQAVIDEVLRLPAFADVMEKYHVEVSEEG